MPTRPTPTEIGAANAMRKDPQFDKHAMEAIINETPTLRDALLKAGLVEEVKKGM